MRNPLAGILEVPARTFSLRHVVGGLIWSSAITLAGCWLDGHISNVDHYLRPIIAVVIALWLIPIVVEIIRSRRAATPSGAVSFEITESEHHR